MLRRSREASRESAEIGPPPPRDKELWERYRYDLFKFLCECFPHSTGLKPFSLHHKRIIDRTQQVILDGGLELNIVFRGFAKSTITENAACWATGYGHRHFFLPISANADMARASLDSIQSEFESNDFLMQIFPAACHAARALEGVPQRASKQTMGGRFTEIEWTGERCVLATWRPENEDEWFEGSGAVIWPKGITAHVRGMRFKRSDGKQARPDFVMCDDIQTEESANSPFQNARRLKTLNHTILRLGGHDKEMACVVNATILEADDAIDRLSDAKNYPAWRTTKVPMMISLADAHDSFWLGKYAETRTAHDQENDADRARAHRAATELYRENRVLADKGAVPAWEHCFIDGLELSAVQHAYNILIDTTEDAFMAECQNAPMRDTGGLVILTPEEMTNKQSGFGRDVVPPDCTTLTAFVDVHPEILYWHVWAWEPRFTGYLVNYGTFPDQRRKYFAHSNLAVKLSSIFRGMDMEATVTAALKFLLHGYDETMPNALANLGMVGLLRREWLRTDGVPLRISRCGIDANGEPADAVKRFIRASEFSAIMHPSYGRGITARHVPISQWSGQKAKGEGPEWTSTKGKPGDPPGVLADVNYWKTRFHRALVLPLGSQGCLSIFKAKPHEHRRLADHWYSEKPKEGTSGTRTIYEWNQRPQTDNHDLDCAVGAMVAASRAGIASIERIVKKSTKKTMREYAALAKHNR
jgi:hypothetical protein